MKKIVQYLIFTFLLTYLTHGLLAILTTNNYLDFYSFFGQLLFIVGGSSPTIFAFVFIIRYSDAKSRQDFKNRLFSYKHKFKFWFLAFFIPIFLGGVFLLSYMIFKNQIFSATAPFYLFFIIMIVSIIFGGLEEIGWRGFLQEKLMNKNESLILIAIVIGIIWGLWHIPLFFIREVSHYDFAFFPFLLGAIMFSTYLSWLYAKTKSILLVIILHASINTSATIGLHLVFEHSFLAYFMIVLLTLIGIGLLYRTQNQNKITVNN